MKFLNVSVAQVIELPIKHPELFESLGIAQPKVISLSLYLSVLRSLFVYILHCIFF